MAKKLFFVSLVLLASAALLVSSVNAAVRQGERRIQQAEQLRVDQTKSVVSDDVPEIGRGTEYAPVGSAKSPVVDSYGKLLGQTYQDLWSYGSANRSVENNPAAATPIKAAVHFVWCNREAGTSGHNRYAYSAYDASNGTLPFPTGKVVVQSNTPTSEQGGRNPQVVVDPNGGKAIIGGFEWKTTDTTGDDTTRIHVAFDGGALAGSFGTMDNGSRIPFDVNYADSHFTSYPRMAFSISGTDTVIYLATTTGGQGLIKVFRKVGKYQPGVDPSWTMVYKDTSYYITHDISVDPTSTRVAVSWIRGGNGDESNSTGGDIWYASSPDGVNTWTRHNVTNITPTTDLCVWLDQMSGFDTEGKFHIAYVAQVTDSGTTYTTLRCKGVHWSEQDPTHFYVFYDASWVARTSYVCGGIGSNVLNIGKLNMASCDGRMYITFVANDPAISGHSDDCARVPSSEHSFNWGGNGEIYMTVSKDLTGKSWDFPRNISQSYSPACDTGYCADDSHGSLTRYGMDDANYAGSKNWTNAITYSFGTTYTGSQYLNFLYSTDRYPGYAPYATTAGPYTVNDVRWVRLACVPPIVQARLSISPDSVWYPEYSKPGTPKNYTVHMQASGNSDLTFTSIDNVMDSTRGVGAGPTGWMTHAYSNTVIPEGGSDSLTLTLNAGGVITSGPTVLYGKLRFIYSPPLDTLELPIRFTVADTIVNTSWQTLSTACTDLAVGTNGNIGHSYGDSAGYSVGKVNMDYYGADLACDTNPSQHGDPSVYLGDGSPVIIRKPTTTTFIGSWGAFSEGFDQPNGFKPVTGGTYAPHGTFTDPGGAFDGFNSGTFLTVDSALKVENTWWAPKTADSCNFIIQRMRVMPAGSADVKNLQIGQLIDFDIPSDSGNGTSAVTASLSANVGGYDAALKLVYQRGFKSTDTGISNNNCADNSRRFGGAALLYYHMKDGACSADLLGGSTISNKTYIYGSVYADSLSKLMGVAGYAINSSIEDISTLLTFKNGYTLPGGDTLSVYTAFATVRDGTVDSLKAAITKAKAYLRGRLKICGCCTGNRGNVNGSGIIDLSDLSALVSYLTGGGYKLGCVDAANVNGVGIVDLSDLSALVSYLTGGGYSLPACP